MPVTGITVAVGYVHDSIVEVKTVGYCRAIASVIVAKAMARKSDWQYPAVDHKVT